MIEKGLGWAPSHDPRSLNYPIRAAIGTVEEKPRTWGLGPVLDQGREGACVGFGWTAELAASPSPDPYLTFALGNQFASTLYREAQHVDEWPGEDYEGTSVLAGAKVVHAGGFIGSYRWCFSVEDLRDAVIAEGPVVIGIPWYESMYYARSTGMVDISGPMVGGHCLLVHGYHPAMRINGEGWFERHRVFRVRNSWGTGWGDGGSGFIRYEDMRDLLANYGEACIPMDRKMVRL